MNIRFSSEISYSWTLKASFVLHKCTLNLYFKLSNIFYSNLFQVRLKINYSNNIKIMQM